MRIIHNTGKKDKGTKLVLTDLEDNLVHGICVSNLTYELAKELGYEENYCKDLAIAGMVHDIGKLQLSGYLYGRAEGSVFDDTGRTISYSKKNRDSAQYMRMHSKLSYDILSPYGYSDTILETVLYHHENFDGTGYPEGLKGEDIPLGARIMRVADTFTALISERPYRHAFDMDTAIEIMIDEIDFYDMRAFLALQRIIHEDSVMEMLNKSREKINVSRKLFGKRLSGLLY